MKDRIKYIKLNWDWRYIDTTAKMNALTKKKYNTYDICISHNRNRCTECYIHAIKRIYSYLKET